MGWMAMEGVTVTNRVEQLRRQLAQHFGVGRRHGTMIQSLSDERDFRGDVSPTGSDLKAATICWC